MEDKKAPIGKPDQETLHTTDPQEHMEGPLSSLMQGVKKEAEKPGEEDQAKVEQAANEKK
ncbi:MAG: hypothetical protein ABW174_15320 [Flavitalea sp.]